MPVFVMFISEKKDLTRDEWLKEDVLCLGRGNDKQHFRDCMYDTAEKMHIRLVGDEGISFITELSETEYQSWSPGARLQDALVLGNL